ncbi:unnamed protein product [Ectocarpus sp. 13 AM-2016]
MGGGEKSEKLKGSIGSSTSRDGSNKPYSNIIGRNNSRNDNDNGTVSDKSDKMSGDKDTKKDGKGTRNKGFEDDHNVPAGSWVQHLHKQGYMFWRNNHTGECTRDLFFGPWGFYPTTQYRELVPASFAPILVDTNEEKASATVDKGKGKGSKKDDEEQQAPPPATWFPQPWEEIYHPVTGKKHWRHRATGEERQKDPLW